MSALVTPPKGIVIHRRDGQLKIIRKWFSDQTIIRIIWLSFWDMGLPIVVWILVSDFRFTPLKYLWNEPVAYVLSLFPDVLMLPVPFLLTIYTVVLNYYVIAEIFNETLVDVDANLITIFHRPFPFGGNRRISSMTIEKLYITRFSWRGRVTYNIRSVIKGKENMKLLSILNNYEQAMFIKREVEEFLALDKGSPTPRALDAGESA